MIRGDGLGRVRLAAAMLAVVLALGVTALVAHALRSGERARRLEHGQAAERVFAAIERRLTALVEREEARPFAHYRYFVVPEDALPGTLALAISPLAQPPDEAGILGWFQIDPDGSFHSPHLPCNADLARLSNGWAGSPELAKRIETLRACTALLVHSEAQAPLADLAPDVVLSGAYQSIADIDQRLNSYESRGNRSGKSQKAPASSVYNFQNEVGDNVLQQEAVQAICDPQLAPVPASIVDQAVVARLKVPGSVPLDAVVAPLRRMHRAGERVTLARTVRVGGADYLQGLVIDLAALRTRLAGEVLGDPAAGLALDWNAVDTPPAGWDYTFAHACAEPFTDLRPHLAMRALPGIAASGRATVWTLGIGLLVVAGGGLWALYRLAAVVVDYARRKGDFVAAVSHELKTPLTAIRLHAELLRDGLVADDGKRAEYHRTIVAESERLSRLIGNVLELANLERGERPLALTVGDPGAVLAEVVAIVTPHAAAAGFVLTVEHEPCPPTRFERDALLQVVMNLVDNAVKFGRAAGNRRIVLRCAPGEDGGAILVVRDHGPGVPASDLGKIFQPFWRGERELTRTTTGTGIGLALVRGLVERMGGRISAGNHPDGGFVVEVALAAG